MITSIQNFFLHTLGPRWCVFFCSLLPIIELRGAIPLGAALGLPWWQTFLIALVGNLLPVPFILLFIRAILGWMKKIRGLSKIALWLEQKADAKKGKIERYEYWGLLLFVALPLPGTGAWTGSLIAALLRLDFRKSFLFITFGVLIAGVIMTLASYGIVGFLSFLAAS